MRARDPDATGVIERDGVHVHWERYGDGHPTVLLLPTWSIVHSRHWKGQIADLARRFRVLTFDGRGNGRSDRPTDTHAYDGVEFVADAIAVLDANGVDRAVIAGLSMGGGYALRMASTYPDRVLGAVFIGASLDLDHAKADDDDDRDDPFHEVLDTDEGWAKYNAAYWRRDYAGFAEWFFGQVFSEPHSTKQIEDSVEWALQTDPETLITAHDSWYLEPPADWDTPDGEPQALAYTRRITCPCLVIHGGDDHVTHHASAVRLADALGAPLVTLEGTGHSPIGREPVRVNLLMRDFITALRGQT